jgi:hypothetical protein
VVFVGPADHSLHHGTYALRPRFQRVAQGAVVAELVNVLKLSFAISARNPVVVVWARTYQRLLLGLASYFRPGSIIYVVHNPEPSRWPSGARRILEDWFLGRVRPVVHSESLRKSLANLCQTDSQVVAHPPYIRWKSRVAARHARRDINGKNIRLLIMGRMERDKFRSLEELIIALDGLPVPATLRVLVRPAVSNLPKTSSLVVENCSGDTWIDDRDLAQALEWTDILLAPYEAVTESGTVQLALTLGVRVVAFSGGAMGESLRSHALAERGDYDELLQAIIRVSHSADGTGRWTAESREADCRRSWEVVLSEDSALRSKP